MTVPSSASSGVIQGRPAASVALPDAGRPSHGPPGIVNHRTRRVVRLDERTEIHDGIAPSIEGGDERRLRRENIAVRATRLPRIARETSVESQ